jgi:hypothetical protein
VASGLDLGPAGWRWTSAAGFSRLLTCMNIQVKLVNIVDPALRLRNRIFALDSNGFPKLNPCL